VVKFKVIQNSLIFKLAHTFVLYLIDIKNKNIFSEMSMNVKQEVRYVVVDLGQPEHLFVSLKTYCKEASYHVHCIWHR